MSMYISTFISMYYFYEAASGQIDVDQIKYYAIYNVIIVIIIIIISV